MTNILSAMSEEANYQIANAHKARALSVAYGEAVVAMTAPLGEKINRISVSYDGFVIYLPGTGDDLTALFKSLAANGWHCQSERPKEMEASWFGMFQKEGFTEYSIWVSFSSTVCKRVLKGKEMREVDVYETVCGEATP